ncbi:MAG TPA: efflux RND transporter permease subunit, partial [Sphingobacteriaceae bacterium]
MNLIRLALQKPISVLVLVAGLFFFGVLAIRDIKVDILPKMNLPVIYIAHPFGGYTPNQMETYFAKQYINILLFANGVKSIETKNIQGLTLMKLTYYEGTNMAQAAAELSALSNRIQAIFPPGSNPPFVIRFDASSLPVGQLVLSSPIRSNNELQDMANIYVRSSFTAIPGLLAPAPFGGNVRTIEINVDPELLRSHNLTPDQIVEAIRLNNQTAPSGNVRIGDKNYITPTNNTLKELKDFENIPLYKGGVQNLYLRDVAKVTDGADVTAGYALINGKRSVYVSIAKSADASTWDVVKGLKANLPRIQSTLPEDVTLSYEFDQSVYVVNAVKSLVIEGVIGAILTGLMVLLFLNDRRAALIVILTIPTSIIAGVLFLKLFGQTINIMTLSGLALAIGILVDESTVTIENIHQHFAMGKSKAVAIWDACREIAFPKLLILLCILAVFAPAFTMAGIPGALFLPLALAIGCTMVVSFVLSQTFVPVMANWIMKNDAHAHSNTGDHKPARFERFRERFIALIDRMLPFRKAIGIAYLVVITALAVVLINTIGRDVLPRVNSSQFQLRLRAPEGTRLERTEEQVHVV